jgi:NADH dehydrogenase
MRLVLIGGTGLFGSALKNALHARGAVVLTAARGRRAKPDTRLDITRNPRPLRQMLQPGDIVVYLVARTPLRRPPGGRREYRKAHVTGVINALEAAAVAGAGRFVYVSALGVRPGCGAGYAESKARAERIVARSPLPATVVAPSIFFDRESEIVRALRLLSRLPVVPLPDPEAPFRPIFLADGARQLAEALLSSQPPARIELTGPEELTFAQVAEAYLRPRGAITLRLPRSLSRLLIGALSSLKLPWLPAELEGMLSIDNAGGAPVEEEEMVRFSRWAREMR